MAALLTVATIDTPAQAQHQDHVSFECTADGLTQSQIGCELLATKNMKIARATPTYWHLTRFASRADAEAAGIGGIVVTTEGAAWLTTFGPEPPKVRHGIRVASVGPLDFPDARSYEVVLYRAVMPPQSATRVHTHPGPEAWYVFSGEQCLQTTLGVKKAGAGESMWVGPNIPMRLSNSGKQVRRALFIVIHDAEKPWVQPSDWHPSGDCGSSSQN